MESYTAVSCFGMPAIRRIRFNPLRHTRFAIPVSKQVSSETYNSSQGQYFPTRSKTLSIRKNIQVPSSQKPLSRRDSVEMELANVDNYLPTGALSPAIEHESSIHNSKAKREKKDVAYK